MLGYYPREVGDSFPRRSDKNHWPGTGEEKRDGIGQDFLDDLLVVREPCGG